MLRCVAGDAALTNTVTAAHVSELSEPGPWLQGNEVLMTIGLLLRDELEAHRVYVAHLQQAAVSGLIVGLGPGLPFPDRSPVGLITAARECGLPLLELPGQIPFIAVTKWIFAQLAEQQRQDLQDSVDASRALTSAAVAPDPLPRMLDAWHATTGISAVVVDLAGGLLASSGRSTSMLTQHGKFFAERITRTGSRSMNWAGDERRLRVDAYSLGAQQPRGVLLLERSTPGKSRSMTSVLVSLLSLHLQHQFTADLPSRMRRSQILAQLLRPGLRPDALHRLAAGADLAIDQTYRVVIIRPLVSDDVDALTTRLSVAFPGALVRARTGAVELLINGVDQEVIPKLEQLSDGRPTGVGGIVKLGQLASSARHAHALLRLSAHTGRPVQVKDSGTSGLLLELGSAEVLSAYSGAILAPLDDLPEPERFELIETLREWLQSNGAWEAAATRLGVHRNTVRNRIGRIASLTERNLDRGDDRFELWLALRSRSTATDGSHSSELPRF